MDSLTLKHHNFFQNKRYKAIRSFAPSPLIFQLQQKVCKFNDLETNLLNLENRSFEYVTFSQQ